MERRKELTLIFVETSRVCETKGKLNDQVVLDCSMGLKFFSMEEEVKYSDTC